MTSMLGMSSYAPLSQRSEKYIFMAPTTRCSEHHDEESIGCCGNIKHEGLQASLRK